MGIPIKNIFGFFTEDDPNKETCEQVEIHEDFINNRIEVVSRNSKILLRS